MAFSGGVYTLPTPALVPGQTVSSSENNTVRNDMAASFNLTMLRNGTSTATANLPMGGYKLTGLGAATTNGDALSYGAAAVVSNLTDTALTITRVPYVSTGGLLVDNSGFTFDGTTLTAGGFSTAGNIAAATASISGNITVTGGTANGVAYLNGSKVLTSGSALTFDGASTYLGIGTASPAQRLHIISSGNAFARIDSGATSTAGVLFNNGNGALYYDATSNYLRFDANAAEQMRLTSTGLGIGTSSPTNKLEVASSTTNTGITIYNNNGFGGLNPRLGFKSLNGYDGSSVLAAVTAVPNSSGNTATSLTFSTSGDNSLASSGLTERMRLDSSGNLGLGVTPSAYSSASLQINTRTSLGQYAGDTHFSNNANYNSGWYYLTTGAATNYYQSSGIHAWRTAPSGTAGNAISFTQAMTLDASGNLGIGTSSPTVFANKNLEVNGTGDSSFNLSVGGTHTAYLYTTASSTSLGSKTSIPLVFNTNNTERMRIDSNGNLGIGSSAPTSKLQVVGLPVYANNAAAIAGGLTAGAFYRTGGDPDPVCVVH